MGIRTTSAGAHRCLGLLREGSRRWVKLLITRGIVVVDSRAYEGNRPLSLAAAGGHEGAVKMLMNREIFCVDLKSLEGDISWSEVARYGRKAIDGILLE